MVRSTANYMSWMITNLHEKSVNSMSGTIKRLSSVATSSFLHSCNSKKSSFGQNTDGIHLSDLPGGFFTSSSPPIYTGQSQHFSLELISFCCPSLSTQSLVQLAESGEHMHMLFTGVYLNYNHR